MKKIEKQFQKNIDKFPHLKNVKESIDDLKNYVELLEKRKRLARAGSSKLSELEQNDSDILIAETQIKISKANKTINERTDYFTEYHEKLMKLYDDVQENWDKLQKKVLKVIEEKTHPNHLKLAEEVKATSVFSKEFEKNWEMKFRHFIELKQLLQPPKDDKIKKFEENRKLEEEQNQGPESKIKTLSGQDIN